MAPPGIDSNCHMSDGHARAFIAALKTEAEREGTVTYTVVDGRSLSCTYNPPMRYGKPDLAHVSVETFLHEWLVDGEFVYEPEVFDLLTGSETAPKPSGESLFAAIARNHR